MVRVQEYIIKPRVSFVTTFKDQIPIEDIQITLKELPTTW